MLRPWAQQARQLTPRWGPVAHLDHAGLLRSHSHGESIDSGQTEETDTLQFGRFLRPKYSVWCVCGHELGLSPTGPKQRKQTETGNLQFGGLPARIHIFGVCVAMWP